MIGPFEAAMRAGRETALAKGLTIPKPGDEPPQITFTFDVNHPKVERIRRVFSAFATFRRLQSGLVIQRAEKDDNAVRAALEELRKVLADEGVDLYEAIQPILNWCPGVVRTDAYLDAAVFGAIFDKLLQEPDSPASKSMPKHVRRHYLNVIDDIKDTVPQAKEKLL